MSGTQKLFYALSLEGLDEAWRDTIEDSRLLSAFRSLINAVRAGLQQIQLGSLLQKLSFCLTVFLFACLTLPQFANDKEALAIFPLIGLLLWIIGALFGGKERRSTNSIDALIILWASINLISAFSSHYFFASLKGLAKVFVYLASYFLLTSQLAQSKQRKLVLVLVILAMGTLTALYGLYQYKIGVAPLATWEDPNVENKATRIYATLNNPNLLAGYLVPLLPLSLSLGLACLWRKQWFISTIAIASSITISLAIILTGSRGAYLGLVGGLLVVFSIAATIIWHQHAKLRMPLMLAFLLASLMPLFAIHSLPAFEQRLTSIFVGREHSSNSFRLNVWLASFAMLRDNWWLGVGVGNQAFCLAYGLYMRSGFDALGTYCVPLEVAVETGIFGLAIFAAIVLAALARGHIHFWQSSAVVSAGKSIYIDGRDWSKWLVAGASAGLVGMMLHGLVDTVFFRPQVQLIFWFMIALVVVV